MSFESQSVTLHGTVHVALPPREAFPLFSPRGEEAWVPGWAPQILHPVGAEWETGLVFRTLHQGQESIWFVRELDRDALRVTYDRVDVGLTATTVSVACREAESGESDVSVSYRFVGISDAGNAFVRAQTEEAHAAKMRQWEAMIGEMLTVQRA